jgi:hypothetical protein
MKLLLPFLSTCIGCSAVVYSGELLKHTIRLALGLI